MELSLGEILTGAVFSLPTEMGRAVMRFASLSTSADYAYGTGFEFMEFDFFSRPLTSIRAPYAKLLPVTVNNKSQLMVITHALSRFDKNISWECEWLYGEKAVSTFVVDIVFEDFLLLSQVRRGLPNLQIDELFLASQKLGSFGYISQIFDAEVLNRINSSVFFLPMAVFVIIIGWRYRATARPRYLFVIMLPVLPIVFNGLVFLYRSVLNTAGIWLVLSLGFTAALAICITALAICLLVSMIALAAQHT
jgi:hypothetical protein